MVIKHLGVNTLRGRLGDERISEEGGYLHVVDESAAEERARAWRSYFEEVDRMRSERYRSSDDRIPEGMEGSYFL